ncbi:ORC1-type DNA replication protein 1 [Halorhabdus tiamatea SARL4B]|uniref:ORC1-type DNA replication protein n=1 Tax=Halorhabdus tiamatea SARL4B TaxID=1033806 RepID=F7PPG1_9EURY|nr:AAA family ATPase [Halorhabdus tiamatea]ERJ04578.1 ORC1-type DNA replication protein 1 [Halorhabdus tiamatea SARL4B]CCQ34933.1 orc1/cdc6 family replication initiation protein [Halorhabdus tiamatea SARL4B]
MSQGFGNEDTIYQDVDVLEADVGKYKPSELPEREDELDKLHMALRPVTMDGSPRDVLVYGPTGQGKTAGVQLKADQLQEWADENDHQLEVVHIPCKGADKSYHVLTRLVKELREIRKGQGVDEPSGYQRKQLFEMVLDELETIGGTVIIILDEIDAIGEDDYVLYELSRANPDPVKIGLIGITNDLQFRNNLDADVRSSLGQREITFNPYNSNHLKNILARRAVQALRDTYFEDGHEDFTHLQSDVLNGGTIPLAASMAAQETGDARQAIELLSYACDLADDEGIGTVAERHVRAAKEEIEKEALIDTIGAETTQRKIALLTVVSAELNDSIGETTNLHRLYLDLCGYIDTNTLKQHTFREKLNDLAHSNILAKDRHGRGRGQGMSNTYSLAGDVDPQSILDTLEDDSRVGDIVDIVRS